jgi:mitofissin-like protein
MVLGRLAHYAFDAILLSTVVASVKHSTGFTCVSLPYSYYVVRKPKISSFLFSPDTSSISNPTVRSLTEQYLGFGETVFNTLQGAVVTSPYFNRGERR